MEQWRRTPTYLREDVLLPRHCEACGCLMGDMSLAAYNAAERVCEDCDRERDDFVHELEQGA